MALLLSENDVRQLLTMPLALEAVERAFCDLAEGTFLLHSRRRIHTPNNGFLHYMAAADFSSGYEGLKIYTYAGGVLRFLVPLFRWDTGELAALIEADYLGRMRTGAASGVATKFMARPDARTLGVVGTGGQAATEVEAICAVRPIERVRVYGRREEKKREFARQVAARVNVPVEPARTAEEAVRGADVVVTATTATHPVIHAAWLAAGAHINAVGSNLAHKCELEGEIVRQAGVIAADSVEQSKIEAGDLIQVFGGDAGRWASVVELAQIVVGRVPGRHDAEEITLFKSNGVAIEDVAVAARIYELARVRKLGREVALFEDA